MKRATILAVMLAATTPALAALPPEYQRAAELRAVIDVASEILGPVDSVVFISNDVYEVRSEDCVMTVTIEDVPSAKGSEPMVGPRQFRAVAQPETCG